jgi:hypothetical protein
MRIFRLGLCLSCLIFISCAKQNKSVRGSDDLPTPRALTEKQTEQLKVPAKSLNQLSGLLTLLLPDAATTAKSSDAVVMQMKAVLDQAKCEHEVVDLTTPADAGQSYTLSINGNACPITLKVTVDEQINANLTTTVFSISYKAKADTFLALADIDEVELGGKTTLIKRGTTTGNPDENTEIEMSLSGVGHSQSQGNFTTLNQISGGYQRAANISATSNQMQCGTGWLGQLNKSHLFKFKDISALFEEKIALKDQGSPQVTYLMNKVNMAPDDYARVFGGIRVASLDSIFTPNCMTGGNQSPPSSAPMPIPTPAAPMIPPRIHSAPYQCDLRVYRISDASLPDLQKAIHKKVQARIPPEIIAHGCDQAQTLTTSIDGLSVTAFLNFMGDYATGEIELQSKTRSGRVFARRDSPADVAVSFTAYTMRLTCAPVATCGP